MNKSLRKKRVKEYQLPLRVQTEIAAETMKVVLPLLLIAVVVSLIGQMVVFDYQGFGQVQSVPLFIGLILTAIVCYKVWCNAPLSAVRFYIATLLCLVAAVCLVRGSFWFAAPLMLPIGIFALIILYSTTRKAVLVQFIILLLFTVISFLGVEGFVNTIPDDGYLPGKLFGYVVNLLLVLGTIYVPFKKLKRLYAEATERNNLLEVTVRELEESRSSEKALAEKKEKLQEQLHQSQKMEAVGQLAGGVAHDFNNALAAIMGATELLKYGNMSESEVKEYHDMILTAAIRASDLTKKLLVFSRKGNNVRVAIDCLKIINDTVSLLNYTIDRNITISIVNRSTYSTIVGDSALLQNAFMNMGINASHAMPNGGQLTFTLENLSLDPEYCAMSSFNLHPGEYVEISIRDTGTGMTPEVQARIFEPFFTTKEAGKGTGLGMAAVYGTVQEHGGAITVYSEVGVGTVFHVYLPVVDAFAAQEDTKEVLPQGTEVILLIDDEDLIRITASAMLKSLGYKVICAENGAEGIKTFLEIRDEVDLVILDMIMPVMGGREAFAALREIEPEIPVVVASGFSKDGDMQALKQQGVSGFLHKPFRRAELADMIAEAIRK